MVKSLLIISDIYKFKNILKSIKKYGEKKYDLLVFTKLNYKKYNIYGIFNKIYDFSSYTRDEIVSMYLEHILDLTYYDKNYKKVKYESIYYNSLQPSNIITERQITQDYFSDNYTYGHYNIIRNYCDFNQTSYLEIEHGLHFGGYVIGYELNNLCPGIITFGDYRYTHLKRRINKPIIKIGPYIHYATNIYTDDFMSHIKNKFGKTLLVFPTHSLSDFFQKYDTNEFINYINEFKNEKNIETVLVCMLYRDIERGEDRYYKDEGFKVVSCGSRNNNVDFLNKLKTLINLCDYSMSNNLGTQIGYCIYLNKPHNLFEQKITYTGSERGLSRELDRGKKFEELLKKEREAFFNAFKGIEDDITAKQYDLCSEYWGFNYIKSKDDMKTILEFYRELFVECQTYMGPNINQNRVCQIYDKYMNLKLDNLSCEKKRLIIENK